MRCPDCNKFVSFDEPEIESSNDAEVNDCEQDDGGQVTGSIRIVLKCADCGNELKDAELDYEATFEHTCKKRKKKQEPEFEVDGEPDFTSTDRYDGKPGTPMRYRRHYYGAEISGIVVCKHCGEKIEFSATVEDRASSFNEC